MKASKLKEQSTEELRQLSLETRRNMAVFKAMRGTKDASEQPLRIRTMRRELARILTVLREQGGETHA
jgi:ribosomal protein L29